MLYFRWFWRNSHLQVVWPLAPNIDTVGSKYGGCLEEKVVFVYFCCWFHVWNCSDLGNVSKNMEKTSQKHQTTTQHYHAINHQNLDVHDFIRLVISSSPFSKKFADRDSQITQGFGASSLQSWNRSSLNLIIMSQTFGRIERIKETSKLVQKDWM